MWFGVDGEDAYWFLSGQLEDALCEMSVTARAAAERRLWSTLGEHTRHDGVVHRSAGWMVTARAVGR